MVPPAALPDSVRRAYEANIWKSYAVHFLVHFQLWWSIWVLYLQDLRGFSLTQITILDALFWGTAVLAEVPTGAVADRYGRKTSLALGAGCTAIAVLVFGLATSYWILLLSYFAWALGIAFFSGAEHALIFESLKAIERENEFQRTAGRLMAIMSFAALAGGLLGAPIAAATNLSVPVLLSAAIIAPAVLVALSMREPELPEGEVRLAYGSLLRESFRTATRLPSVRYMLLLSAMITAFTFGPLIFMQPFLADHGVGVGWVGFIQTPVRIAGIVGALVAASVTARFGTRRVFQAAPLIIVGAFVWLGALDTLHAFAAFPLIMFVNSLLLPPSTDYLNRRISNTQRATVLSIRTMLVSLALVALEPVLGVTADAASLQAVFWLSSGAAAVVLSVSLFLWLRADSQEGKEVLAPRPETPPGR